LLYKPYTPLLVLGQYKADGCPEPFPSGGEGAGQVQTPRHETRMQMWTRIPLCWTQSYRTPTRILVKILMRSSFVYKNMATVYENNELI
jgi:hypothetical protein